MKTRLGGWIVGLWILGLGSSVSAAEPTLKIGDRAPALATGQWIQGEPVRTFESGKAYVVEFWATWCGPCRVSIPHLNEVHNKFKDKGLVVIGQDVWESNDALVDPFVKKMGDKMTYRVALDDKSNHSGRMAETWMKAAGQDGIPTAFVVDTHGVVAWIGHPMELKDRVIEEVLAGKYDLEMAKRDKAEADAKNQRISAAWRETNEAIEAKRWDDASAKLEELAKLLGKDDMLTAEMLRLSILLGKGEVDAAYQQMTKLSESDPKNENLHNLLAWRIVSDKAIKKPDLKLAGTFANRANQIAEGKDASILDTLARVKFMQGNKAEAVALLRKAVELSDGESRTTFQNTLRHYEKGELPDRAQELSDDAWGKGGAGKWKEAADEFQQLIEMEPESHFHYLALQALLVQLGDVKAYDEVRGKVLKVFGATEDPMVAERMVKACLALPCTGAALEALGKMADGAVTRGKEHVYFTYFKFAKALAEYRAGHLEAALEWGQKVLDAKEETVREAQTFLVMAMAHQRLNQPDKAKAALAKGAELLDKEPKLDSGKLGSSFHDIVIAHALMREAKAVVETGGKVSAARQ